MSSEAPRICVLADDLIWSSRLAAAVEKGGGRAVRSSSAQQLGQLLAQGDRPAAVLIDLNGRAYDGVEAVRAAAASGSAVLAVGQHEDQQLRRRALAAGARRVFSYNKLFRDGPQVVADLLDGRL